MPDSATLPMLHIPEALFDREPDWKALLHHAPHADAHDTLIIDERKTIKAREVDAPDNLDTLTLPRQSVSTHHDADFQLLEQLGEGGMGVVHLARQSSLLRQVAIKRLHERDTPRGHQRRKLLQEACITGRLEHPNIVPVYSLSMDDQERPLFAMKHIEGVSWFDTIQDEQLLPRAHRQHGTLLESHFEIFEQVCMAIHYAHSKGIIHRDLKPDNVMLGEYGEVYVVDWGLAVSIDPREDNPIPLARDVNQVEGTPMYMSPEQASAEGALIGPHSDVYALGAILHELVTGGPRHQGDTLQAMLLNAYRALPHDYSAEIPDALAAICNKACTRQPTERHASGEALREDLNDYREHQRFHEVLLATTSHIDQLEDLYTHTPDQEPLDTSLLIRAYSLSGACRFGLEQALVLSPEDPSITHLRTRMLQLMLRVELTHKNLAAAQVFKQELGDAIEPRDARWFQRVTDELAAESEHIASLKHLEQDLSFGVSRRKKGILGMTLVVIWGLGSFALRPLIGGSQDVGQSFENAVTFKVVVMLVMGVLWVVARRSITPTAVNRKWLNMLPLVVLCGLFARLTAWSVGLDIHHSIIVEMFCYGIIACSVGILLDRMVLLVGLFYALGVGAALLWSMTTHTADVYALCNLATMLLMSWRWFSGTGSMIRAREH